jgi:hypothetical protein
MRKIILLLMLFSVITVKAEYNGIFFEVSVQLHNGEKSHGYKYIPHASDSEESIKMFESNPESILNNQCTHEPGKFGLYKDQLEYTPAGKRTLYKLINPFEIEFNSVKYVKILSTKSGSYAIQIDGNHTVSDQEWMRTIPIAKYSSEENEMCSSRIYIHATSLIPSEEIERILLIINDSNEKIKSKINEFYKLNSRNEEGYKRLNTFKKEVEKERDKKILPYFNKYKSLKTVIITTCTC